MFRRQRISDAENGRLGWRLPPGVRDADCDGPVTTWDDLPANQLWRKCSEHQQERLCDQFAALNIAIFRDAILDAEDLSSGGLTASAREDFLGGILWSAWIRFRDTALRQLCRSGELGQS
jgi:hypothetical protein